MIKKIKEFCFFSKFQQKIKLFKNFGFSLLIIIIGIFLLPKTAQLSVITPEKLIELTNQERLKAGLTPLTANQLLAKAALAKAEAIFKTQIFKHNLGDKKFSSWVSEAGYHYSYVGENSALDFTTSEGVITAWNNSSSHQKNLLNSYYQEIGVASMPGQFAGQETTVVVEVFGAPPQATVYSPFNTPVSLANNFTNFDLAETKLSNHLLPENLLTHTLYNSLSLPGGDYQLIVGHPKLTNPGLNNKIIEQFNYFQPLYQSFSLTLSFIVLLSILYLYYFYFFKIFNLKKL